MEIRNLPKRKDVLIRVPLSESEPESELYHQLLVLGWRGHKQYPISNFFVDIAFPESHLVVEYDGNKYHQDRERDAGREKVIRSLGYDILRVGRYQKQHQPYSILLNGNDIGLKDAPNWEFQNETAIAKCAKIADEILTDRNIMEFVIDTEKPREFAPLDSLIKNKFSKR